MEDLALFLLSLPRWLPGAIIGALGGVVGYLVGALLSRSSGNKNASKFVGAVAVALSVQLSGKVLATLRDTYADAVIVKEMKTNRLFSVLFRVHPEAETEMRAQMRGIMKQRASVSETRLLAQNASAAIVNRYFSQHLASASDAVTYSMLVHNLDVMHRLAPSRPEMCVAYYLGSSKSVIDVGDDFLATETNLKADVIESSLANPSLPPRAANMDKLFEELAEAYFRKGYTLDDMSHLDNLTELPAQVACDSVIKFNDAMVSLPPQRASYIFKNLQYFAAADQQRAEAPQQR